MIKNNGFHNRHSPVLPPLPLSLFASGAPGVWYDPSDYSTLFQDSTGATPVTAVEQPVGRMLDKSGYGNHATQGTSASRPVLSARYNLLTKTEQFDDAAWTKIRTTIIANAIAAPDGTLTADKVVEGAQAQTHAVQSASLIILSAAHIGSCYMKAGERTWALIEIGTTTGGFAYFNLSAGTVGTVTGGYTATITPISNGWYRCSVSGTIAASGIGALTVYTATGNGGVSYTGDGTSGIYVWGASLLPLNQASLPYQRVNTSTDYDTTGFLPYLKFDGVDDSLITSSISFISTDKVSTFAGVRKLSDAARGMIFELSATSASNNGSFGMTAPNAASATYAFESKGTSLTDAVGTPFAASLTSVLSGLARISTDSNILRVNGVQADSDAGDQGTGNYGNYPLYIGRRGGSSLPFNGQLYSLIIVGKAVTATELSLTEAWVNGKTGAY